MIDIIPIISHYIRKGISLFEKRHASNLVMLIFNYTSIIMYIICIIVLEPKVDVPVITEDNFQRYIDGAALLAILLYISCVSTFIMVSRSVTLLSLLFPIFLSIYLTVKKGLWDLMNILLALVCIFYGLAVTICLFYGSDYFEFDTLFECFIAAFYVCLTVGALGDQDATFQDPRVTVFWQLFFIALVAIIVFTLVNVFISIVIVWYRYLRSQIQIKSQAEFLLIKEKAKNYIDLGISLFLCRRPKVKGARESEDNDVNLTTNVKFKMNMYEIVS
jgi:hypothetical protein